MKKTKLQELIKSMTYGILSYDDYCRVHEFFYDFLKDAPESISCEELASLFNSIHMDDVHTERLILNIILAIICIYNALSLPR